MLDELVANVLALADVDPDRVEVERIDTRLLRAFRITDIVLNAYLVGLSHATARPPLFPRIGCVMRPIAGASVRATTGAMGGVSRAPGTGGSKTTRPRQRHPLTNEFVSIR
jgi:hypothetical protein